MAAERLIRKRKTRVSNPVPEACSLKIELDEPSALSDDLHRIAKTISEKTEKGELDAANGSAVATLYKLVAAKCLAQCELMKAEAEEIDSVRIASSEYQRVLDEAIESAVSR